MMLRLAILALALVLAAACQRYDPYAGLSEPERAAVDKITADQWVELWRTDRDRDGHLIVWTRQGEERVRYRVVVLPEAGPDEEAFRIRRIGDHPVIGGSGGGTVDPGSRRRYD